MTNAEPALTPSPEQLVARCLRGDERAWALLVDRYARLVYAVGVRHGLSAPEVEDVAQEVFTALAQALPSLRTPEALPAWLLMTARRHCWRAVQRLRREALPETAGLGDDAPGSRGAPLSANAPSMDELNDLWHRQALLAAGMARLSARCRTLLHMLFLDDAEPSYDEISAALALPKGSIGPTRSRCLQQLRAILDGLEAQDR